MAVPCRVPQNDFLKRPSRFTLYLLVFAAHTTPPALVPPARPHILHSYYKTATPSRTYNSPQPPAHRTPALQKIPPSFTFLLLVVAAPITPPALATLVRPHILHPCLNPPLPHAQLTAELSRPTSSKWCSQTSIFSLQLHLPSPPQGACAAHSRVARNGTSDIACRTTTGQASHLETSTIQMHHVEGYTDLEWPIDARNRRNVSCACFIHAQTRPEITPYTQKVLATVRQTARSTPGAPRTARLPKCAIYRSKHEPEAACPCCTRPQKSSAHVIWPRQKTRPGIFSQS